MTGFHMVRNSTATKSEMIKNFERMSNISLPAVTRQSLLSINHVQLLHELSQMMGRHENG